MRNGRKRDGSSTKRKKATPRSDRQHGSKIPNSTPRICIADSNQCQKYEEFSSACTSIRHVEPRTTTILCNLTAILVRLTSNPTLASEHAELMTCNMQHLTPSKSARKIGALVKTTVFSSKNPNDWRNVGKDGQNLHHFAALLRGMCVR